MARPLTNRANYWSGPHEAMLVTLAAQVCRSFRRTHPWLGLEIAELMSVGWFRVLRYRRADNLRGTGMHLRREMVQFARREIAATSACRLDRRDTEREPLKAKS